MKKKHLLTCFLFILTTTLLAQENYVPSKENLASRKWFEEAKFGLFIHWGAYSVLGEGEWVMSVKNIDVQTYEKLSTFFNPTAYDAEKWVKMAKDAGMNYITITARHHDGFSMFDSKVTDYTIVQRSPYKKDILKALAEACRKEGIKLFFYYSLVDWYRDDYFPRGTSGKGINGKGEGKWEDYIAFMKAQLTELLTNYGEIAGIWFDGDWDQRPHGVHSPLVADWHYNEIYELIHRLQPQCLIGNNRHLSPLKGEDFQMFERDLPGQTKTAFGTKASEIGALPKEVCGTINGSWGYHLYDKTHKSTKELLSYLIRAAGHGSNLLLNVGPMPNGEIQPEHVESLKKMGAWLKVYGETIYGTTAGPVPPNDFMVSTQKGNTIYLHLLEDTDETIFISGFNLKVNRVKLYKNGKKLAYKILPEGLLLTIPQEERDGIDTIVEIN